MCQIGGPVVRTSGSLYGGATGFNSRADSFFCIYQWSRSCCCWFSDPHLRRQHHSVYFWPFFGHCVINPFMCEFQISLAVAPAWVFLCTWCFRMWLLRNSTFNPHCPQTMARSLFLFIGCFQLVNFKFQFQTSFYFLGTDWIEVCSASFIHVKVVIFTFADNFFFFFNFRPGKKYPKKFENF